MEKYTKSAIIALFFLFSAFSLNAQDTVAIGDSLMLSLETSIEGTVQWEQSENNGISWEEIPGATAHKSMVVMPHYRVHYRARVQGEGCEIFRSEAIMVVPEKPD